ncbi:hypothetical protein QVD17_41393 [Tagetes erecta]|uniref:Uncharacterized protein n=1 Tax=Tagetes erecta TaxID=13708 RepID=A0AAD8JP77_TARER|nr:hypothetical protein QVD17_41393 [Tagetes erecta]
MLHISKSIKICNKNVYLFSSLCIKIALCCLFNVEYTHIGEKDNGVLEEDSIDALEPPNSCNGNLKYAHRKRVQQRWSEKGDITFEICHQP